MQIRPLDVAAVRRQFPGLARRAGEREAVFFDGPAGSQVPRRVVDAMADYMLHENGNHGGAFATSVRTDERIAAARAAMADFVCAADPETIVFGPNMTTLTFQLSRALARTWRRGDEIVVTDSDHDANVTPWVLAARDAGVTVRSIAVRADSTLDTACAEAKIGPRTRLVALGAASNLSGTIHPVRALCDLAHRHGALAFVDAVHYAPHLRLDVEALGCDFLVCSPYKFFGPHAGVLWGRSELLAALEAYKVRPPADHGAEKWQTGTASFEAMVGTTAAVDYLADLGRSCVTESLPNRRRALDAAFAAIAAHEQDLCARLLRGLAALPGVRIVGVTDPARMGERCATVSFTTVRHTPAALARMLAANHVHCWAGNSYALALTQALGLEPDGVLRLGLLHYHTGEEVDHVLGVLRHA